MGHNASLFTQPSLVQSKARSARVALHEMREMIMIHEIALSGQHNTVQYSTAQHNTTQHNTAH